MNGNEAAVAIIGIIAIALCLITDTLCSFASEMDRKKKHHDKD